MGAEPAPPPLRLVRVGFVADVDPDDLVADAAVVVLERRLARLGLVPDVHARTVDDTAPTLTSARWRRADTPWPSKIDLVVVDDTVSPDALSGLTAPGIPVVTIAWCALGDYLIDELRRLLDPSTVEVRRAVLEHVGAAPNSAVDAAVSRDRQRPDDEIEARVATALDRVVEHLSPDAALTSDELAAALRSLDQRHEVARRADALLLDAAQSRLDELTAECERLRRRVEALNSHGPR